MISQMEFLRMLLLFYINIRTVHSFAPVIICPGFGNDAIDYDTPLEQSSEVGLKSVLNRRGFEMEQIYTVPVQRSDWIRVAGGLLDIPRFYTGNALPTGPGYGWYIQRVKETVDKAYEESGGQKVILLGHSAGGWLARAAMADGVWSENENDDADATDVIRTSDRVQCLVTMGAIHKVPENESTCVTRGALKYTDNMYPGAFLKDEGIKYISIGGAAITGDNTKEDVKQKEINGDGKGATSAADALYSNRGEGSASRVAYTSYEAVSGSGDIIGDGVVPLDWSMLEGANQIRLDGVLHSINEAGTTMPTDRWYGAEGVVDRWLPEVLKETGINSKSNTDKGDGVDNIFAGLQEWASNLVSNSENTDKNDGSNRRGFMLSSVAIGTSCLFSSSASNPEPALAAMYDNAPVSGSELVKLPSGVTYQDLRSGDGAIVSEGDRVNIQWALKRSNGYSIDSSSNNDGVPFIFTVGNTDSKNGQVAIKGLDEGIRGMRVGAIRRIVMPPSLTYVDGLDDGAPGPIPPGFGPKQRIRRVIELRMDVPDESFILDVKATRVQ